MKPATKFMQLYLPCNRIFHEHTGAWLCTSNMPFDKSQRAGIDLFTVAILHNDMIGAAKDQQMFLLRTKQAINFAAIARGHHVIMHSGHNQSRGGDTWQLLAQLWKVI